MAYSVISLNDMYYSLGENDTKKILNSFECKMNKDVEFFLKEKAIQFLKMGISKTFLVTTKYKGKEVLIGYFALTNKVVRIKKKLLSNSLRKKIIRFSEKSNSEKNYIVSLPLIGQLGKNYRGLFRGEGPFRGAPGKCGCDAGASCQGKGEDAGVCGAGDSHHEAERVDGGRHRALSHT